MAESTEFQAECERCGEVTTFRESERERRRVKSDRRAMAGEFTIDRERGFECKQCRAFVERALDVDGAIHKWSGRRHTRFTPD